MITQEQLDDLMAFIETLSEQLMDSPEDRELAIMLSGTIDNYNAKLKLFHQDNS